MKIFVLIVIICASFITKLNGVGLKYNEEYKGYRVYSVKFETQYQQDNFNKLKNDIIDFWRKPSVKYGVVGKAMVPPSQFDWFEDQLKELEVEKDIIIEDVYGYLKSKEQKPARNNRDENTVFDFNAYYRYERILEHLNVLQDAFEDISAKLEVVQYGVTEENRPLVYLKITKGNNPNKPVVVIESAINPREWITVPSALNVVTRLLDQDQRKLLEDLTWIVIPVLNPDGYEYTHTNLRFWTKSRSLNNDLGFICPGVNLNRNFDIDWQNSDSSSSPCSHVYAGTEPFSEIETKLVRDIIKEYNPKLYISLQNNGNFVTFPWRFEKAASGLFRRHFLLGLDMINNLDDYNLDSGAIAFGDRESGTSTDYARMNGVFYTFNISVEGEGDEGVLISEEKIQIVVEDVWKAVLAAVSGVELNIDTEGNLSSI